MSCDPTVLIVKTSLGSFPPEAFGISLNKLKPTQQRSSETHTARNSSVRIDSTAVPDRANSFGLQL